MGACSCFKLARHQICIYTYINRCTHHRVGEKEEIEGGGMGKRLGLTF